MLGVSLRPRDRLAALEPRLADDLDDGVGGEAVRHRDRVAVVRREAVGRVAVANREIGLGRDYRFASSA